MTDQAVDLRDREDLEDELEQVISDSIDMDWAARTGARAVLSWLDDHGFAIVPVEQVRSVAAILRRYESEHKARAERAERDKRPHLVVERYEKATRDAEAAQRLEGLFHHDVLWKGIFEPKGDKGPSGKAWFKL